MEGIELLGILAQLSLLPYPDLHLCPVKTRWNLRTFPKQYQKYTLLDSLSFCTYVVCRRFLSDCLGDLLHLYFSPACCLHIPPCFSLSVERICDLPIFGMWLLCSLVRMTWFYSNITLGWWRMQFSLDLLCPLGSGCSQRKRPWSSKACVLQLNLLIDRS